jgi:hypothetical protein
MTFRISLYVIVLLLFATTAFSASPILTEFSAMSDQIRLAPDGPAKRITVSVPAIVFQPPIIIKNIRDNASYPYEEVNVYKNYFKTYYWSAISMRIPSFQSSGGN